MQASRPRVRRPISGVASLILVPLLTVLVACSASEEGDVPPTPGPASAAASDSASAAPPPRATEPPAPDAKACYRLDFDDALAPTSEARPVRCAGKHTALTYAVGRIDNVVGGHLLAVDSKRVQASVARRCPRQLQGFVGGSQEDLRLSMLRSVWFTPTVEQSDAGADWVRCDVIAVAGPDRLAALGAGRLSGVLASPQGLERFAMCGTAAPDDPEFERVLCRTSHSWRAVSVVDLPNGRYPGVERVREQGQAPCQDAGREAASDPLDFKWGYEFPTEDQWRSGQTFGRCWAPDR